MTLRKCEGPTRVECARRARRAEKREARRRRKAWARFDAAMALIADARASAPNATEQERACWREIASELRAFALFGYDEGEEPLRPRTR